MAVTRATDVLVAKLLAQYGTTKGTAFPELWQQYWADATAGNNGGVAKQGQNLLNHIGGSTALGFDDRLDAWANALTFGPITKVEDIFTGADGSNIAGRVASPTPGLAAWEQAGDPGNTTMKILANAASQNGATGMRNVISTGVSDFTLTADCHTGTTSVQDIGVIFCVDSGNSDSPIFFYTQATEWRLQVDGTVRGTYVSVPATNTTYALKVVKLGNDISCYLDGTLRISYTLAGAEITAHATKTRHGIYAFGATSWWIDNFKVTT